MADNTIDSLVLEISSNSKGAEKALDKLADSLQKLSNSLGGMNTAKFMYISKGIREMSSSLAGFSANVKLADFNRVSNGLNKIAGIDAAGVRSAAVAMNGLMKSLNNMTFLNFDIKGITDVANGIAKLGRGTVTQATTNIPLLTESLKGLSNGLKGLKINFDIDSLSQLTASIQKLGSKSATKAAETNIIALGKALKEMMGILSKAPTVSQNIIQMTNALAQLAAAGGRAGTASRSLMGSFNILPSATSKAKKGFSGLAGAIGKFYATYWLLIRAMSGFRKAIDISSDLTEVQNVVDVTFGEMSNAMNEFADSALQNYGMSELMAKQIASRFQSMGVAMGFAQGKMSEMSIELTKLTGDMASFYNESQESVAKALQSIFTGETEPMRRFGLDLSFATVEAWALAQGIDADMRKMTQAEKTMLRYQYVLANTGAASGDFLRTINSWHNQLVLLAGGFQQLASIVGGVLINAFKPFIQALNSVMGAVINFAQVVSDALGAIFGWEYQVGGGVAQDLEAGAGAAGGIEDAMGGAADNAKKLNKYIAGWHEVNNMTSDDSKKGGSGGGGGAGGAGTADGGQWIQKESLWEKYTSSIDTLYELGEYIGGVLTDAMNRIDWDTVYESARNFGTGLASFLNGLISPELFGALGQTIAGALNTALHFLDGFGTEFDWVDFGNSIASGINNFFATFDFALLANTIDVWIQGIWTTIKTTIENIEWKNIWDGIKEFISNIDLGTVAIIIGAISIKKIGKFIFGGALLKELAATFGFRLAKELGTAPVITTLSAGIKALFGSAAAKSSLTFMFPEASAVLSAVQTFFTGTLVPAITSGFTSIGTAIGLSGTAAIVGGGALVVGAAVAAVAAITAAVTHWDEIKIFFTETIPSWWNGTALPFFQSIPDKLGEIWENVKSLASEKWGQFLDFMQGVPDKVSEIVASIGNWFGQLPEKIGYGLGYALGTITKWGSDVFEYLKNKIPEVIENVKNNFSEMKDKIYTEIQKFISETLPRWKENVSSFFLEKVPEIIKSVSDQFAKMKDSIFTAINGFITETLPRWKNNIISFWNVNIPEIINKAVELFGTIKEKMVTVGEDLIRGLWNGIKNMVDWLGTNIKGFVNGVIDGFKDGFDEHSPSKIAFEIGDFWTVGLGNGMIGGFDDIYRRIYGFTSKVGDINIPVPQLNTYVPKPKFTPTSYDLGKFRSTMQMEMDAKIAEQQWEIRQQNELLREQNELLRGIYNKPTLSDDDVFNATRRGQNKFQRRTFRTGWAGID